MDISVVECIRNSVFYWRQDYGSYYVPVPSISYFKDNLFCQTKTLNLRKDHLIMLESPFLMTFS